MQGIFQRNLKFSEKMTENRFFRFLFLSVIVSKLPPLLLLTVFYEFYSNIVNKIYVFNANTVTYVVK